MNSTTPTTAMIAVAIGSALLLGCQSPAGAKAAKSGPRLPVIYNLDLSQFYVGTFGPVVPETIDTFVDAHAGSMHVASDQPRATSGAVSRARSELVTGPGHVAASRPSRSSTTVVGRPLTA